MQNAQKVADLQQAIANLKTAHTTAVTASAKRQITANIKRMEQQLKYFTK